MEIMSPSSRQTLSYIRNLLQSRRLTPKSKMGQNFLIDLNLLDVIESAAELTKEDCILEVGTGTGGLTARLSDAAGSVLSVELDGPFFDLASGHLAGRKNLRLLHADALERKNELNPGMLLAWEEQFRNFGCTKRKLVANLPYAIATPIIGNLLTADIPIERMVVMVQWELAERMVAEASTKPYGALSILVQSTCDVEILRRLAPTVFWPKPAVDSAIVRIRPNAAKRERITNVAALRAFLRDLYTHRRKNLRQALVGWPTGHKDKHDVDAKLRELGIDGTLRAETMDIATHLRLVAAFGEQDA